MCGYIKNYLKRIALQNDMQLSKSLHAKWTNNPTIYSSIRSSISISN
jgi:hypothetical protein